MPSLVEALEGKYGPDDTEALDQGLPIAIYVPRKGPRNIVPSLLVLNDCDINSAGDEHDLQKKCHAVEELDLAQNNLTNWADVSVTFYTASEDYLKCINHITSFSP